MDLSAALNAASTSERPRFDHATGRLVGSRCPACATVSWPSRAVCHVCGSAGLTTQPLDEVGTLVSWTRCWVRRPGLDPPFVLGKVKLGPGVTVFGHVEGLEAIAGAQPVEVRCVLAPPGTVPAYRFEVIA